MTLEDLAAASPRSAERPVPDWTLGCFHRRCITYANGAEDADTLVVWIQSHGLTGDLRIPAWRPRPAGGDLGGCTREELALLASVEGGVADTEWRDGRMHWNNWTAFQPYDKWPEPGLLQRVGTCLIEVAPSGIYVEDWRLQPGSGGLLAGLRLMAEAGPDGLWRPRDGGLVVAGGHAILALGRREPVAEGASAASLVEAAEDLQGVTAAVFDAETAYARRAAAGTWVIDACTNPFREGQPLSLDGFEAGAAADELLQTDGNVQRRWRIDTLVTGRPESQATQATPEGLRWLERESGTLLR